MSTESSFNTMSREPSGKKSARLPEAPFHISTHPRASATRRPKTPESNPTPTKPPSSTDSSPLSSPPTSLGSSPKSIAASPKEPAKSSPKKRKVSFDQSADDGLESTAATPSKKPKVTSEVAPDEANDDEDFAREPPKPPPPSMFYGADAKTRYRPSEQPTESAPSSPPRALRGGGRGRGRGGRLANGGGRGRGKARDHGDRDDTPEPPPEKHVLTEEERAMITSLRARQQELKKFFQIVGAQQNGILDLIASRDIAKLVKKAKAHKKVPEYDTTTKTLEEKMEQECDLFRLKYDMDLGAAEKLYEAEKASIEQRFQERVLMAQKEHVKGAEGEIMLLEQAGHAANDDTRTEAGSDADVFPMYHQTPEPGPVRGYNSTSVIDEKALQRHDTTFNDQVRREVIDDDIITPMARALFEKNTEHKREQARKKTKNMTALSEEAMKQLKEIPGYLVPRPMLMSEMNSFGLSALADAAEFMAQRYPRNNYEYVPLPPGKHFPVNALNFAPLPGMQQGVQPGSQQRRPPPPPPAQTFIFQPPQQFFNRQQQRMPPPPPPPIPVTFVNSTVSSRKSGNKGGQRVLLPKMG